MAGVDRGRPRDPGNDASILDAALDLLIERGAGGASIEAIAKRAGVAKLTVYRRWQSKEDLLMAALEYARSADVDVDAGTDTDATGRSIDELVEFIAELLSRPRFRALMARVIGASVDYPKLVKAYTERYLQPRLTALADTVRQAVDAGLFPPGTDPVAIQDVLSSAIGFVLLRGEDEVTAEQIAHRLRTLLRQMGYRAPAG
ncbi:TetR/AcrR family transcriptional regulator [Streptosporangium sp. NPDC000396]|uniref:TetR/AcrR family transcriptional regulator n=1 Tax=Streptosporangium sp. NPDC000396 TaxID=3366185 RepID=UPI0036CB9B22